MSSEVSVGGKSNAAPTAVDRHCMASVDMFSACALLASHSTAFTGGPQTLLGELLANLDLDRSARNGTSMDHSGKRTSQLAGVYRLLRSKLSF